MQSDSSLIQFETVKEAMMKAGVQLTTKTVTNILQWRDTYSSRIDYRKLRPWQVINRIPFSNVLCLKVQLSIIIRDAQNKFPANFDFVPTTFILPDDLEKFNIEVDKVNNEYKSDLESESPKNHIPKKIHKDKKTSKGTDATVSDNLSILYEESTPNQESNLTLPSCSHNNNPIKDYSSSDDEDIEFAKKYEFIIKPSNGSLGLGIRFLHIGETLDESNFNFEFFSKAKEKEYQEKIACSNSNEMLTNQNDKNDNDTTSDPLNICDNVQTTTVVSSSSDSPKKSRLPNTSYVAQRYIPSYLIDDTKFDLRIYVLVSSVDPFEIYIYRNGLCRFCSFKSTVNSRLARITNVSMNKNRFSNQDPEKISRLISDVFEEHFTEEQQKQIWSGIDDLVVLTLFASHRYLKTGSEQFIRNYFIRSKSNSTGHANETANIETLNNEPENVATSNNEQNNTDLSNNEQNKTKLLNNEQNKLETCNDIASNGQNNINIPKSDKSNLNISANSDYETVDINNEIEYSRCFQIFGFDILLHENDLKPYLIEVNYRPSLKYLRNCERRMKVDMIKDAIRIGAPHERMQQLINSRKWALSIPLWESELNNNRHILDEERQIKKRIIRESNYDRIWPMKKKDIKANPVKYQEYTNILRELDQLPVDPTLITI